MEKEAFTDVATGTLVNSGFLTGKSVAEAKEAIIAWLQEKGVGVARYSGENTTKTPPTAASYPSPSLPYRHSTDMSSPPNCAFWQSVILRYSSGGKRSHYRMAAGKRRRRCQEEL